MTKSTRTTPRKPTRASLALRYLSIGLRAPSVSLFDPREDRCASLQIGDPNGDAAQVVVHEAAVGADPRELAVVLRRPLQRHVDQPLSLSSSGATRFSWSTVPARGGRALDSSSAMDAVPRTQRVDGGADRVAVVRQLGRQPLELVQRAREPLALLAQRASTVSRWSTSCSSAVLLSANVFENDDVRLSSDCNVSPWPWKICKQRVGERVDVLRVQPADHRLEAAEQQVEVERRLGAVRRNLCAARESPGSIRDRRRVRGTGRRRG